MNGWNIAVAASPGQESVAEAVRLRLSKAWASPEGVETTFTTTNVQQLVPDQIRKFHAVVLVVEAAAKYSHLLRPLGACEEAHVPVMTMHDQRPEPGNVFEHAGALVESHSTPDASLCATLNGMLHRQREVNSLREDITLSQRSQGGLRGEIAKIHEELQLAALVQREFLPRELPSLHGVSLAALWRPTHYVSGDIYDVIRLDQDHLGIFLADAVGHGVPAALMTMVICQSLSTRALEGSTWRILSPAKVLTRLNAEMIARQGQPTRFATAVYALLNCRSRHLRIAVAGHPPPLLVHSDGRAAEVESAGGLLGVFKDEHYGELEFELEVGDRLLLYSDGFEQAFPSRQKDSYERRLPNTRYRQEFEDLCKLDCPRDMVESISRRLDVQSGSLHQADDLTLICVHAGPLASAPPQPPAAPAHAYSEALLPGTSGTPEKTMRSTSLD